MAAGTRTVRRLRLRAGDAAGIRRGALLLEDALRTASLPDAGGRIVAVRRLALGVIDARAPPQKLASALERRFAQLGAACVHADDPNAAAAPAVWFRDALEAHTLLALRLAAGAPADAWYWPLAIRAWVPNLAAGPALRQLALSVAALPEAAAALPAWSAGLVRAGHGERLAESLHDEDIAPLAEAAGLKPVRNIGAGTAPGPPPIFPMTAKDLLRALVRSADGPRGGVQRPALRSITGTRPGRASFQGKPAVQPPTRPFSFGAESERGGIRASNPPNPRRHGDGTPQPYQAQSLGTRADERPAPAPVATLRQRQPQRQPQSAGPPDSPAVGAPAHDEGTQDRRAQEPESDGSGAQALFRFDTWIGDYPTAAGGLLFLVPVLVRLGYPEWLEAQPAWARWDVARGMFALILARLAIPADDPAWRLTVRSVARTAPPRRFVAPERWRPGLTSGSGGPWIADCGGVTCLRDPSTRLLLAAWRGPRPRALLRLLREARPLTSGCGDRDLADLATAAWLTASRRWLRRYAGIGLADLVPRPAALSLTTTHVDCFFHHDQAELPLRRAGLDVDPGWVPWLRRVVGFHYGTRDEP